MYDIIIVGSGPAGMSAALYAKRANLNVAVLEKVYYGTGQIAESSQVDNYLGLAGINGYELGGKFRQHVESLGVEWKEGEADAFLRTAEGWDVHLLSGEVLKARAVIYAAGAAHRHLDIPGEAELSGKGVSYCATCDGAFFRGKEVAVVGGGDTALDDALYLSKLAKKVYLVHRREEFRGSAHTVEKLKQADNVEFVLKAVPAKIDGTDRVTGLTMEDGRTLKADGVFIAVGMAPETKSVEDVVSLDAGGYIIADETGVTSAEGFFVAGDVRTKKLRQVVTAVSDGANAATSAEEYLMRE